MKAHQAQTSTSQARDSAAHSWHSVHFYFTDACLARTLCHRIGPALASGSSAVVIATQSHSAALAAGLETLGADFHGAVREGRYLTLDASEVLSRMVVRGRLNEGRFREIVGNMLQTARGASRGKDRAVIAFGEIVALLWAEGRHEDTLELERFWNRLPRPASLSLVCGYPIQGFRSKNHESSFLKICAEHNLVVPEDKQTILH